MSEIFLVRHAQASFELDDYDRISPLGRYQAHCLGEYFSEREIVFDRVVTGTQNRHAQTAQGIMLAQGESQKTTQHPGLNEYDFDAIYAKFSKVEPSISIPSRSSLRGGKENGRHNKLQYYRVLKMALNAWSKGELGGEGIESWIEFAKRVNTGFDEARNIRGHGKRVLVVTSGGVISMILGRVLGLSASTSIDLNMQAYNTGVSRLFFNESNVSLASFNAVPHLESKSKQSLMSFG